MPEIVYINEIRQASKQMKQGGTAGEDKILIETLQQGGEAILNQIKGLFNQCLDQK